MILHSLHLAGLCQRLWHWFSHLCWQHSCGYSCWKWSESQVELCQRLAVSRSVLGSLEFHVLTTRFTLDSLDGLDVLRPDCSWCSEYTRCNCSHSSWRGWTSAVWTSCFPTLKGKPECTRRSIVLHPCVSMVWPPLLF